MQKIFVRRNPIVLPFAGDSPARAHVPAAQNQIGQVLTEQSLTLPFILLVREFPSDPERSEVPVQVHSQTQSVPIYKNRREERFARDCLRPYTAEPLWHVTGSEGEPKLRSLDRVGDFQEAQGGSGQTSRKSPPGASDSAARAGIFTIVLENPGFVVQASFEKAAVRCDPVVPAGRDGIADTRAVNKIEPHRTDQLVQPERNLEFSGSDLEVAKVPNIYEYIAPGIHLTKLPFNLVLKMFEKSPVDTNPLSPDLKDP